MNMRLAVSAALAVVALWATTACGTATVGATSGPANIGDLLVVLRQIVDERALARDDFYTQAELSRRFGRTPVIRLEEPQGPSRIASVVGFADFADLPPRPPLPNGIYIDLRRTRVRSGPQAGTTICDLRASFFGFSAGMDFASVVTRLGPDWRRDAAAENEKFMAVTREPFNPPFPSATAPMGNAVIAYGTGDRQIEL